MVLDRHRRSGLSFVDLRTDRGYLYERTVPVKESRPGVGSSNGTMFESVGNRYGRKIVSTGFRLVQTGAI